MTTPTDRRFTETHEWLKADAPSPAAGSTITLGVTQFAVDQLTDITYVQMKPVGSKIAAGGIIGEIESVKATSDIYSPLAGEIIEINKALTDDPGLVNRDPYNAGWLIRLKTSDPAPWAKLMDAPAYDKAKGH